MEVYRNLINPNLVNRYSECVGERCCSETTDVFLAVAVVIRQTAATMRLARTIVLGQPSHRILQSVRLA